ncbi:alpha/beta hydrolase [Streptomyces alanosinicus]|nr:alpha/beta hydrolase [Streptomyces alanosinicus]
MSLPRTAGVLAVATLMVTACSAERGADPRREDGTRGTSLPRLPARFTQQKIDWAGCQGITSEPVAGAECGWVEVPVDYAAPGTDTLKLRVSRVKAQDHGRRLGSLLYNPGGPGAPGAVDVAEGSWQAGKEARARYDLVGFDPRGLGASSPIECPDGAPQEPEDTPRTVAEAEKAFAAARGLARSCQKGSGMVLAHMDSVSVARDLDVLRSVLGDRRLNYTGISYGTFLGQQYMKLFPDKVGRMVLDGVVNPARDMRQVALLDVRTAEEALRRYAGHLVAQGDLRLGATPEDVIQRITGLVADLERSPLTGPEGRRLTDSTVSAHLRTATRQENWRPLTDALVAATHGDAGAFDRMDEEGAAGAGEDGTGGADETTPQQEKQERTEAMGNAAVLCLDSRGAPTSPREMLDTADEFARKSPLFGRGFAWQMLDCATWPVAATGKTEPITARTAPPVLLVSYTDDPQTPLENARAVHRQLAHSSLLVRTGQGHGAYASQTPSACTDRVVDAYLVGGRLPEDAANCPG